MKEHESCSELVYSLSEYVDGTLDERLCAELERHMQDCQNCRVVVNTLRKTIELYRTSPAEDMPDDVRSRLYACLDLNDFLQKEKEEG